MRTDRQIRGWNLRQPVAGLAIAAVFAAFVFAGCTQEAWKRENWTWNPFEDKSKTTPPEAGTKARRPNSTATASNTPRDGAQTNKTSGDDERAKRVNRDVDNYANRFPNKRGESANGASDNAYASRDSGARHDAAGTDAPRQPRIQRTAKRGPETTTSNPPRTGATSAAPAPSGNNMSDELVLLPDGGVSTPTSPPPAVADRTPVSSTPNSGTPTDVSSNSNDTGNSSTNGAASGAVLHSEAGTITATHDNAPPANTTDSGNVGAMTNSQSPTRPPVLGSIKIEAGADNARTVTDESPEIEFTDNKVAVATPPKSTPVETTPAVKHAPEPSNPAPQKPFESQKPVTNDAGMTSTATPTTPTNINPPPAVADKPKTETMQPVVPVTPVKTEREPAAPDSTSTANHPAPVASNSNKAADLEAAVNREPNNIDLQMKYRMACLLEGNEDKALAPTQGMTEETQKIVMAQVKSIASNKSASARDTNAWAAKQMESAEQIRTAAKDKADLSIPRVMLCTSIRAFGDYTPIDPAIFPAGKKNKVLVYIEVDNFASKQVPDGQYKTELSLRESLLDAKGKELWSQQTPKIEDVSRQPRRDFFISTGARGIPASLPPGEYFYKVEIEDLQAGKINGNQTKFKLVSSSSK